MRETTDNHNIRPGKLINVTAFPSGRPRSRLRTSAAGPLAAVLFLLATGPAAGDVDFSPLFRYHEHGNVTHWQIAGPLFELRLSDCPREDTLIAVPRPLVVRFRDRQAKVSAWDAVWPLAASRTRSDGHYTYVLNFLHTRKQEEARRQRWWLWPLLFTGRDDLNQPYAAVFPVGGTIADAGFADRASLLLFPLYLKTEQADLVQHSVMWPVFSRGRSDRTDKWRVFPLYGINRQEGSTRRFVLWPLLHLGHTETENISSDAFFLFPLYGDIRQYDATGEIKARSRTLLWPFGKYETGPGRQKIHLPWPFLQYEENDKPGAEEEKKYLWPVYGRRTRPDSDYRFFVWPLFHYHAAAGNGYETRMQWFFPVWQKQQIFSRHHEEPALVVRRLWPLWRQRRTEERHEISALNLWPASMPPVIDRNYAPLWQLYHYVDSPDETTHTLLWGLWRRSRTETTRQDRIFPLFDYRRNEAGERSISLLTGLFGVSREPQGQLRTRFLWIFERQP